MGDLEFALDLMRRLPPANVEQNLYNLCDMVPDMMGDLLGSVDQPLKIAHDSKHRKDYLLCDYNRDGDSYRSPWSNTYEPSLPDGAVPSAKLRELEMHANEAFDVYREMYFEGGVSSVYLWDTEDNGFAGVVLIKKTQDQSRQGQPMRGTWDSIHVVEISGSKPASYRLTSTIMLSIETETEATGRVSLAGNLTRQEEAKFPITTQQSHIANMGRMIENMENKLRTTIETIYFGKTKDIASDLRNIMSSSALKARDAAYKSIGASIQPRN